MEQYEFQKKVLDGVKAQGEIIKSCEEDVKSLKETANTQATKIASLERRRIGIGAASMGSKIPGFVSDQAARGIAGAFILHAARKGAIDEWVTVRSVRDNLITEACSTYGINVKTALSTTDIPLPVEYFGEIRELISQFGIVRKQMSPFPIGMGTAKPPRMGTRPAFGSIAMSGTFSEKSPTVNYASLESHKIGGLVRLPREIDEQSMVQMGQFLARYGAIEFARVEDTWGFLADGSATYESVKGVVQICRDNSKTVVLGATKTHASDATLTDFRNLRTKVNKAALSGRLSAYYLDSTWETQLPNFKTTADPYVYQRLPDGTAVLDGYFVQRRGFSGSWQESGVSWA